MTGFGCQRLRVPTLVAAPIAGTDSASGFRGGRGNALDFDQHPWVGKRRDADKRAGGRIFRPEITGGDFIEDILAFHLRRKDRELHDVLDLRAGRVQDLLDVHESTLGLLAKIPGEPPALLVRIMRMPMIGWHGTTAGEEDQPATFD